MGKLLQQLGMVFNRKSIGNLRHILESVDNSLGEVSQNIAFLELEYNINTATGSCLDEWSSWFSIYRHGGESDNSFRSRILFKIVRPTSTIPALQLAISNYYNSVSGEQMLRPIDIPIIESYTLLKTLSGSGGFSGSHRFPDDGIYNYNVLQIVLPEVATPELIELVNDIRACGVRVYCRVRGEDEPYVPIDPTLPPVPVDPVIPPVPVPEPPTDYKTFSRSGAFNGVNKFPG